MSRPVHFDRLPSPRRQAVYRVAAGVALAALAGQLGWQLWPREPQRGAVLLALSAPLPSLPPRSTARPAPAQVQRPAPAHDAAPADPPPAPADANEPQALNAGIDPHALSTSRPMAAQAFLREVWISPEPRGGYLVRWVLADGVYDRMGLRAGDRIYSLDTPAMSRIDETSMVAVMQQTEIDMEVVRNGTPTHLRVALNVDDSHAASPDDRP